MIPTAKTSPLTIASLAFRRHHPTDNPSFQFHHVRNNACLQQVPNCDSTPEQIREACRKVRDGWMECEKSVRSGQVNGKPELTVSAVWNRVKVRRRDAGNTPSLSAAVWKAVARSLCSTPREKMLHKIFKLPYNIRRVKKCTSSSTAEGDHHPNQFH